jgi:dolichol-phosphate mannosyltransferase|tara:strand:+ start:3350 stop:4060 length:711 start_codon:yes stop_codon:yes gene_type:complete
MDEVSYSIVCCLYNEKNILEKKFEQFTEFLKKIPFKKEIIICDNFSTDGTIELLKKFEENKDNDFKYIYNKKNLGKGGSIREAIANSTNEYIIIFDIDEYSAMDLLYGHEIIKKDRSIDFLCGSRMGENNKFIYKKNKYGVILFTKLINLLYKTNLSDSACAIKIFRRKIYNQLKIYNNNFDFEFEVLCKFAKKSALITEYKVEYSPRTVAEGKKLRAIKDGSMILKAIIKCYIKQ